MAISVPLPFLFPVVPSTSLQSLVLRLAPFHSAGPVFVLANLIVLAILISSGFLTVLDPSPSIHFSLHRRLLQLLASITKHRYPVAADASARLLPENPTSCSGGQLPFLAASSQSDLCQKSPAVTSAQRLNSAPAIAQRPSEVSMPIEESKQSLAISTPIDVLRRSNSDQGRSTETSSVADLDAASNLSLAHCDDLSSPVHFADQSLVTTASVNDDDFQRKCEDFISNFHAKLKKEALA